MSRTTKPCPGCGEVKPGRSANSVCRDCSKALAGWKTHVASVEQIALKGEQVVTVLSEARQGWPGFFAGNCSSMDRGV
jgi:hypothetical protein